MGDFLKRLFMYYHICYLDISIAHFVIQLIILL